MKKRMVSMAFLMCFSLTAIAETSQAANDFVRAVQGLVSTEKVIVGKGKSGEDRDVGLLIHERELFSSSSELKDNGRLVLEKARAVARKTNRKLTILVPDERLNPDFRPVAYPLYGGQARRNVFVGPYVYIVIAQAAY